MKKSLLLATCLLAAAGQASAIDAPDGLSYSDYDGESITVSWNPVDGATGYKVSLWTLGASVTETKETNLTVSSSNPEAYTPAVNGHLDETILTYKVTGVSDKNADETMPLYFKQADANHNTSSIFVGSIYVGQLAPYQQVSSKSIFGGYPIDEFTQCLWIYTPGGTTAPGVLNITKVTNTYRPNVYVIEDKAVSGSETSLKVTGLDPEQNYYAAVKAVSGQNVSEQSEILKLDCVLPVVLTGATDFTSTSYTANWETVPKATGYEVSNFKVLEAGETPVENVLLEDNFDTATEGTFDKPTERINPDDYTNMPGWTVNSAIIGEGMFGTFGGMIIGGRPYGGGYMITPALGFSDGEATVSFRLRSGAPGADEITVYIGEYNAENAKVLAVPADGIIETSVTLKGASSGAQVHFESKNLKKFMLDNIKIHQTLEAGQKSIMKISSERLENVTSHTFTGLDPETKYAYSVRPFFIDFFGSEFNGEESAPKEVGSFAAIDSIEDDANLSPVVSVVYTDLSGRRILTPAPGSLVIRTEIHADGTRTHSKFIAR